MKNKIAALQNKFVDFVATPCKTCVNQQINEI